MSSKQNGTPMTVYEKVHSFPTKHKEGFIQAEIDELLKQFYDVRMDKFNDAMRGNTCMIIDGEVIIYHCDVLTALRCGLENRGIRTSEWD